MKNLTHRWSQSEYFFPKLWYFFQFLKKGWGDLPNNNKMTKIEPRVVKREGEKNFFFIFLKTFKQNLKHLPTILVIIFWNFTIF